MVLFTKPANLSTAIFRYLISIVMLQHLTSGFQFASLVVASNSYTINTDATYTISYNRQYDPSFSPIDVTAHPLATTDTMTITFPSQYDLSKTIASIKCTVALNSGAVTQRTCSLTPGTNQLVIVGAFAAESIVRTIALTVSNILNPSPAAITSEFAGTIGTDTSATGVGGDNYVILIAAAFQSCSITFNPATVNSESSMVLTLSPTNQIPQNGKIVITLPGNRWENDVSTSSVLPIQSSMVCSSITPNVEASISCAGNPSFLQITAQNLFGTSGNNFPFQFQVQKFWSPPTNQPSDLIQIKSQINSNQIDKCQTYVTDLVPKTITQFSVTDTSGQQLTVNQEYIIKFSFTTVDLIDGNDYITIEFPSGSSMIYDVNVNGIPRYSSTSSYADATRVLTLYFRDTGRQTASGTNAYVNVGTYTAPTSILPTGDFIISVMRNGYPVMTGKTQLIASPNIVTGSVITADQKVNALTSYTFTVIINDALTSSGKIRIIIPAQITIITSSTNCAILSGSVGSFKTPTCIISGQTITLTDLSSTSANIAPQTLTITINDIQNPPSIKTSTNFDISTYYTDDDATLVAEGSISGITATVAIIDPSQITITPSSQTVNDKSVTYKVQLDLVNKIPIGGSFEIYVPIQIGVNLGAVPSLCSINIQGSSFQSTVCTASSPNPQYSMIKFTNPFTSQINNGDFFIARIQNVFTNPISTAPSPSFQVKTYWADGSQIAQITQAIPVTMNTADSFTLAVTRDSNKNYEITSYHFEITQESPYQAESILIITFPSNIKPLSGIVCNIKAPTTETLVCSLSDLVLTVTLPSSVIPKLTKLELSISNIRNPPSFEEPGAFTFHSKTKNDLFSYSHDILLDTNMRNNIPTAFQDIRGVFTPKVFGQAVKLEVSFNPSNSGVVPKYLRLNLANSFTITSISCNAFDDIINGACVAKTTNTIEIQGTFVASQMDFSIEGFTSPQTNPVDFTSLVSFDDNDNKLDESTDTIIFAHQCTLPCRTCQTGTPTICLTCYDKASISPKIFYDSDSKSCYDNCPDGKYQKTDNKQCTVCDDNCLTCQGSPTFCESCKTDTQFKYLRKDSPTIQICVSSCLQGFYPNSNVDPAVCQACKSPCVTCIDENQCQSCGDPNFLLGTDCLPACTVGLYIENSATHKCDPCDSSCKTCEQVVTKCTSCESPKILYQDECLNECPSPLVPKDNTCGSCNSPCKTCQDLPDTCTSCIPTTLTPYLHESSCLDDCPPNYYQNIGEGKCSLCSSVVDLNCENCITSSTCLSCDPGFVLYQQKCLDKAPDGYVDISGVAQPCTGDCETCETNQHTCTSCKTKYLSGTDCIDTCLDGQVGINKVCKACQSPCRTCQTSQTNCLSCQINLNPPKYYINNQCLQNCPKGTYPEDSTKTCQNCQSPCEYCKSLAVCETCLNSYFLQQTSCVQQCKDGFVGVNRVCQPCSDGCATCSQSPKLCTTCLNDTYLFQLNSSCVTNCGQGLFIDQLEKKCVYCTEPCNTCQTTPTTCLSCLTGILHSQKCVINCPQTYFNLLGTCTKCPSNCASCESLTKCLSCNSPYVLYNQFCIQECPKTHAVLLNQQCTKCGDNFCKQCTQADVCTMCESDYSLLKGTCLDECPVVYETNGTHCNQINQEVLSSDNSTFPVPFTIAAIVFIIACLMSKLQFSHTYLPGAVYSLLSILEWGALVYFLYLFYTQKFKEETMPLFIGLGALGYLYLMNIIAIISQNYILCKDKLFGQWYQGCNKCCTVIANIFSFLINHKFRNILFCKLFTFSMFSAYLQNTSKFKIFNILSFLSLVHSGGAIFAASIALTYAEASTQLYYECIDVIVVTALNVFMAFFNVLKPRDFFYQRTSDGFDLNKKIKVDDQLIQKNVYPAGNDQQEQIGQFSSCMHQTGSNMGSTAPLRFGSTRKNFDIEQDNEYSFGSLLQRREREVNREQEQDIEELDEEHKSYHEISIQAVEIIGDKFDDTRIDFTSIDKQGNIQEDNSHYTVFFEQSDKNIQNTIEKTQFTEIGIQNSMDKGPQVTDKSIQKTQRIPVDQSVQKFDTIDNVDRSIQHTVFYQDDSAQYGSSIRSKKPSMKNQSIQQSQQKASMHNKSIMQQPSVRDQSGQKSTLQREQIGIQGSLQQSEKSLQVAPSMHNQSNQNTYSVHSQSQQITQKSYKNQSIQNQPTISNKSVQIQNQAAYDQINEDIEPSKTTTNVIFEEEQQDNQKEAKQLKQQQKDQLVMVPAGQMKSYQQQLEDRIREREKQLNVLKRKVETKQKSMQMRETRMKKKNKGTFEVEVGKLYNKGERSESYDSNSLPNNNNSKEQEEIRERIEIRQNNYNHPLRRQHKILEEENQFDVEQTIEQISVVDDSGDTQKIKVNFNNQQQEQSDDVMMDNYENQIMYEGSDGQDDGQELIQERENLFKLNQVQQYDRQPTASRHSNIRLQQQNRSRSNRQSVGQQKPNINHNRNLNYMESEAEIPSVQQGEEKDGGSTNLQSSRIPYRNKPKDINDKKTNPLLQVKHIDKSLYQGDSSDLASNFYRPPQNYRSDMQGTIQQIHPNLNRTTEYRSGKNKSKEKSPKQPYIQNQYNREMSSQEKKPDQSRASKQRINQKIKQMVPHSKNSKKPIPQQRHEGNDQLPRRFTYQNIEAPTKISPKKESNHSRKSSFVIAAQSQLASPDARLAYKKPKNESPLKMAKKWQFERQDKNVSDSEEENVKNMRKPNIINSNPKMQIPFQTDKEQTSFKNVSYLGSQQLQYEQPPRKMSPSKTQQDPIIKQMQSQKIPIKPQVRLQQQYGTDVYDQSQNISAQPYIEGDSEDSEVASRYKNNMILEHMLDRPDNRDIKDYYERHGHTNTRSKGKRRKNSSTKKSTQKIYGQRIGQSRR